MKELENKEVGQFFDTAAGKKRPIDAVAGRILEEAVELALTAGLLPHQVRGHVQDALENQSLKLQFPQRIETPGDAMSQECADVGIQIKDFCYLAGIDQAKAERSRWESLKAAGFRLAASGVAYPSSKSDEGNHV